MRSFRSAVALAAGIGALVALSWALPGPRAAHAAFIVSDGDGTIDVAELIGGSDPNDPNSGPESIGGGIYLGQPFCSDGIDNDLDGDTDAADAGCVDSDNDLADDPVEINFGSDPNDPDSLPEHSMVDAVLASLGFVQGFCGDGVDNDLDGFIDDADPGCAPFDSDEDGFDDVTEKTAGSEPYVAGSVPEDEATNPGSCSDGQDNDGDGAIDGADSGCTGFPTPTQPAPTAGTPAGATPTATGAPAVSALPSSGSGPASGSPEVGLVAALAGAGLAAGGAFVALRVRRRPGKS